MYFVGNRDSATLIRSSARKTGFIAIEFRPHGAFPIFGVPMSETANRLWETDSVFGPWSREVQETVNNIEDVKQKVAVGCGNSVWVKYRACRPTTRRRRGPFGPVRRVSTRAAADRSAVPID